MNLGPLTIEQHRQRVGPDPDGEKERATRRRLRELGGVDPVVKYDGQSRPVRLSQTGLNRAERRALARELRSRR